MEELETIFWKTVDSQNLRKSEVLLVLSNIMKKLSTQAESIVSKEELKNAIAKVVREKLENYET